MGMRDETSQSNHRASSKSWVEGLDCQALQHVPGPVQLVHDHGVFSSGFSHHSVSVVAECIIVISSNVFYTTQQAFISLWNSKFGVSCYVTVTEYFLACVFLRSCNWVHESEIVFEFQSEVPAGRWYALLHDEARDLQFVRTAGRSTTLREHPGSANIHPGSAWLNWNSKHSSENSKWGDMSPAHGIYTASVFNSKLSVPSDLNKWSKQSWVQPVSAES